MTPISNVTRLAARAASILADWTGLSPLAKAIGSDDPSQSAFGLLLLARLMANGEGTPEGAPEQIAHYIEASLRERGESFYLSLSTDYTPEFRLREMIDTLKLRCTWPTKSMLTISGGTRDPGVLQAQRGTHGTSVVYTLCPELSGWLITNDFAVPGPLRAITVAAVLAGDPVARWEPFA